MGIHDDRNDVRSKLEYIIGGSPDTILIIDKNLELKEVVSAKDELTCKLKEIAVGKTPEEIYTDERTLSELHRCQKTVINVLNNQMEADLDYTIWYENHVYHYKTKIRPYTNKEVILYARNINSLKTQETSQELIHTILDHLPLGVFVKDAEDHFNYLYWNKFMEEMTGITTSAIEGHSDQEVNYDALISAEERLQLDHDIIKSGHCAELHGKVKSVAGDYRDIEVTKFPISLSNGRPLLLALWRDITTKLQVEENFKRTMVLTKMALLSNDIRTCSIFVNPDSTNDYDDSVVQLNDWSLESNGIRSISWGAFLSRVHPEDEEEYRKLFIRMCRGEIKDIKHEFRVKYPEKEDYYWREISAYVYERDVEGRPSIILGCSTDIEMRKNQELTLEVAREKAELADKMKSKYLADMSHEIRTPLNAITGFSELMAFADSDEERMSYYEIIKTNNLLLMQLINDILDISKIEADAIKISYESVDINELMDTTFAAVKLRMPQGVELILKKGLGSCSFGTDSIRLLQLINNLVNNAIKNTKTGSITMGYTSQGDGVLKFYVKDTGVGIAADKLETLFTRFVKVNDYVEGIGLGLAICQGLVTKMGGSMHVESEPGVGSVFSFVLPSHD